jgi:hypothetical protein
MSGLFAGDASECTVAVGSPSQDGPTAPTVADEDIWVVSPANATLARGTSTLALPFGDHSVSS